MHNWQAQNKEQPWHSDPSSKREGTSCAESHQYLSTFTAGSRSHKEQNSVSTKRQKISKCLCSSSPFVLPAERASSITRLREVIFLLQGFVQSCISRTKVLKNVMEDNFQMSTNERAGFHQDTLANGPEVLCKLSRADRMHHWNCYKWPFFLWGRLLIWDLRAFTKHITEHLICSRRKCRVTRHIFFSWCFFDTSCARINKATKLPHFSVTTRTLRACRVTNSTSPSKFAV